MRSWRRAFSRFRLSLAVTFSILQCTFLQHQTEGCIEYVEANEVLRRLDSEEMNAVVVSFRNRWDSNDIAWSRYLKNKKTAWYFFNDGFKSFLQTSARNGRKTLALVSSLKIGLPLFLRLVNSSFAYNAAVHWVLVRDDPVLSDEASVLAKPLSPVKLSVLRRCKLGISGAYIYSDRLRSSTFFTAQELLASGSLTEVTWRPRQYRFTAEKLVVSCLNPVNRQISSRQRMQPTQDICGNWRYAFLYALLKHKNVSLTYINSISNRDAVSGVIGGRVDFILGVVSLDGRMLEAFSFAGANIHYDTFYARANDTRSVSMCDVLSYSTWGLGLTLLSMLTSTLVLTSINSARARKAFSKSAAREATFLLASLLATSAPEPRHYRRPWTRRVVYACWMMNILSLSVYLRSEMTAHVTARGPADHLDTLEELEEAVDARRVAPVVAKDTANFDILNRAALHSYTLLRKLNAAFRRHRAEELLVPTLEDCLLQAGRHDRVCYSPVHPQCSVQKLAPGVRPFQEPMMMTLNGMPVRHGFTYLPALRKLLLAIREGSLTTARVIGCGSNPTETNEPSVELLEFISHYCLLQLVTVAFFAGECLTYHFLKVRRLLRK